MSSNARDYLGEAPRAGRSWYRGHGLGNDYLVFDAGDAWTVTGEAARRVCHRLEGVGGDGVVVVAGEATPFALRMFNPDGSEFERSGNGLRIVASHLHRTGRVTDVPFRVRVGGDEVRMQVHGLSIDGEYDVSVEMGVASVGPGAVALDEAALDGDSRLEHPELGSVPVAPVSVGNPHAVVWAELLEGAEMTLDYLRRLGPGLATHPAFAHGTNVQLARVTARGPGGGGAVEALVWERGAGHTTASGTSSCAVAVSAVESGRLEPGEVEVRLEGGSLFADVGEGLEVTLRGPVREIAEGELARGFVRGLEGVRSAPGS